MAIKGFDGNPLQETEKPHTTPEQYEQAIKELNLQLAKARGSWVALSSQRNDVARPARISGQADMRERVLEVLQAWGDGGYESLPFRFRLMAAWMILFKPPATMGGLSAAVLIERVKSLALID